MTRSMTGSKQTGNKSAANEPGTEKRKAKSLTANFKPTYFTYSEYLIISDKVAVELMYHNLNKTNVSQGEKI